MTGPELSPVLALSVPPAAIGALIAGGFGALIPLWKAHQRGGWWVATPFAVLALLGGYQAGIAGAVLVGALGAWLVHRSTEEPSILGARADPLAGSTTREQADAASPPEAALPEASLALPGDDNDDYELFDPAQSSVVPEGPGDEAYAMWWPSDGDEDPLAWNGLAANSRLFEDLDGIESYFLAHLLAKTNAGAEEAARVAVPDHPVQLLLQRPDGLRVLVNIGKEKGVRFQFPMDPTPPEERDRLVRAIARTAFHMRRGLSRMGAPLDEEDMRSRGREWWTMLVEHMEESGGTTQALGMQMAAPPSPPDGAREGAEA